MALSRQKKTEIVDGLVGCLEAAKMTVLVDYRGLTVAQMESLRREASETTTTVRVIKNRLLLQAIARVDRLSGLSAGLDLDGMRLCVFSDGDEVDGARLVRTFVKKTRAPLKMVGAISSQGHLLDSSVLNKLAGLPPRAVLLAAVVGSLKQPLAEMTPRLSRLGAILSQLKAAKTTT